MPKAIFFLLLTLLAAASGMAGTRAAALRRPVVKNRGTSGMTPSTVRIAPSLIDAINEARSMKTKSTTRAAFVDAAKRDQSSEIGAADRLAECISRSNSRGEADECELKWQEEVAMMEADGWGMWAVCLSHAAVQGADGRPCVGNGDGGNAKGTCAGHGMSVFFFACEWCTVVLCRVVRGSRGHSLFYCSCQHITQTRHNDLARVRYITVQSSSSPIALFSHPASSVIASPNKQHP